MVFKTDYGLMQVKSITFDDLYKLPVVIKTFVFEWPFYTGFIVDKGTGQTKCL